MVYQIYEVIQSKVEKKSSVFFLKVNSLQTAE